MVRQICASNAEGNALFFVYLLFDKSDARIGLAIGFDVFLFLSLFQSARHVRFKPLIRLVFARLLHRFDTHARERIRLDRLT